MEHWAYANDYEKTILALLHRMRNILMTGTDENALAAADTILDLVELGGSLLEDESNE